MKTRRKYELRNTLGREDCSILAVKTSQANYRLEEEVLQKSASASSVIKAEDDDVSNHNNL